MIVQLNGTSLAEARRASQRFVERTNSTSSIDDPKPRRYRLEDRAAALERERMRAKVSGTRHLRERMLGVLDAWRAGIVAAFRVRESATAAEVDTELDAAVAAGIMTPAERDALVARINAALEKMDPAELEQAFAEVQRDLYTIGVASARSEVGIAWDIPPEAALNALGTMTIPFARKIVEREVAAIQDALKAGLAAGDSIPSLRERIKNTLDDGMHVYDDSGTLTRVVPTDAWAETVARTEVSRAMTAGLLDVYFAAGVARVQWIAAEDERTCPVCDDLDGSIVLLGQQFADGSSAPPEHPNCRCTIVSVPS